MPAVCEAVNVDCSQSPIFLEWILQNQAGHLMVFTQCSILNRDSPDVDEKRSPFVRQRTERIELHLGREHPFLAYLGLSTFPIILFGHIKQESWCNISLTSLNCQNKILIFHVPVCLRHPSNGSKQKTGSIDGIIAIFSVLVNSLYFHVTFKV